MILGIITLITALAISAVAIYYSVAGLVAIFAAATIPIMIMGGTLEIAKLVTTVWLHKYWHRATWWLRSYLAIAVVILMFITSMGIFGFLSKAHSDQSLVSGDVQSKIALYDEKIKIERENIANSQQLIKQMDAAVNGVISTGDQEIKLKNGTTQIRSAAERSLQIRRSQAKDRSELTKQIEQAQGRILALQEQRAPIAAEVRKVEAEVGPIKYIAALIYGENTDTNLLEKAVTWVIIIIIFVFDPLAVLLLLAAQYTFEFRRKDQEEEKAKVTAQPVPTNDVVEESIELGPNEYIPDPEEPVESQQAEVQIEETKPVEDIDEAADQESAEEKSRREIYEELDSQDSVKDLKHQWKTDHPEENLKLYKRLYIQGKIDNLPWLAGYVQNGEQDENSLWNKLRNR